jgi:hypothetical protein
MAEEKPTFETYKKAGSWIPEKGRITLVLIEDYRRDVAPTSDKLEL